MFYEMLSGQLPRPGQSLVDLVPSLHPDCQDFVNKAMAADPADRFSSAREFREALTALFEKAKASTSDMATPVPIASTPVPRWRRILNRLWPFRRTQSA
jgi:serine/threonine protein kinase